MPFKNFLRLRGFYFTIFIQSSTDRDEVLSIVDLNESKRPRERTFTKINGTLVLKFACCIFAASLSFHRKWYFVSPIFLDPQQAESTPFET